MSEQFISRRDFQRLSAAAFGGALVGSLAGCQGEVPAPATSTATSVAKSDTDFHLCRGLNECKGQGADGKNECAGQGTCASKSTLHDCAGANTCAGQGGCGENPGENKCKAEGSCHVPLMDGAWKKLRAKFETSMKDKGKTVGTAPEPKEG